MPSSIDDQALQGSVRKGQKIDRAILAERGAEVAPQKGGVGRWMFLLAAMMITAGLAAVGMMNMREATSTEPEADKIFEQRHQRIQGSAGLRCYRFLALYEVPKSVWHN